MSKINFIKKISYHPVVIRVIRFFHLRPIFRKWYYRLVRPPDGILRFQIGGINAQFYVGKPEELRSLEADKEGERQVSELLISHLQPGDVVYDIGANLGFYTIILAKVVGEKGKVIAFEPEKESYNRLQENLKLNNLTNNVRIFQKALGSEIGEGRLSLGQTTGNFSLIKTYEKEIDYQKVEIVEGDQFVKKQNLPLPKVVKIDVEGYEYSVLSGLKETLCSPNCETVCCEVHPFLLPSEINGERILELLKSFGFKKFETYRRIKDYHLIAYKNKKLKVLVCAYACLGESGVKVKGGEAVLGWNVVKQLARFHQVFVLTHSQNQGEIEKTLEKGLLPNIKFYYLNLPKWLSFLEKFPGGIQIRSYFWQVNAYFFARKLHRKFRFDVFHHVTYANDWMASFIGALLPIPYIRGPGGGAHRTPRAFVRQYPVLGRLWERLRAMGQWLFRHDPFFVIGQRRARAILVCNREALEAIPQKWRYKAHLFPVNGVSERDFTLFASVRTPDNKFRVLSAGKLLRLKAFDLAIRAFKAFAERGAEAELIIIGDGPELGRLKALVESIELQTQVQFESWLPHEELLVEMASSDVFLFPSLRDGGGAVVVEAMAAGKPVICLDIGGPGLHVTEQCGIKVAPYSPEQAVAEMARALERLYSDKELRLRMGQAARARAEQAYHWDRLGERLQEIYEQALRFPITEAKLESNR